MSTSNSIFYNAHHAPIGAFASFTLGYKGAKGGLGLELGKPADQNVYIGLQACDGEHYQALPFMKRVKMRAAVMMWRSWTVEVSLTVRGQNR